MSREHILIGVPTLDYKVSTGVAQLFTRAQELNYTQDRFVFSIATVAGVKTGVDLARNTIVKTFLGNPKADRLWMIDDDMMPEMDVFGILDVDADIIAPLMPTMKFDFSPGHLHFEAAYAAGDYGDINDLSTEKDPDLTSKGPVDVGIVGTGCIAIRRKVLEDERLRYGDGTDDPPAIFRYHKKANGEHELGEDTDFCLRANRLGYSVKLHTGIEVGHLRWIDLQHIFRIREHYKRQSADFMRNHPVANAI